MCFSTGTLRRALGACDYQHMLFVDVSDRTQHIRTHPTPRTFRLHEQLPPHDEFPSGLRHEFHSALVDLLACGFAALSRC